MKNIQCLQNLFFNFFTLASACNVFCYEKRSHNWNSVESLACPVFAITGTNDQPITAVCNPEPALDILKGYLKNSKYSKTLVINGAEHSFEGYENLLIKEITNFLKTL